MVDAVAAAAAPSSYFLTSLPRHGNAGCSIPDVYSCTSHLALNPSTSASRLIRGKVCAFTGVTARCSCRWKRSSKLAV